MNKKFFTAASIACAMAAVLICGNLCGCSDETDTSSSTSVIETTEVNKTTAQVDTTVGSETVESSTATDAKTEETTVEKTTEETKATDADKKSEEKSENKDNKEDNNEKDNNKKEENKGNSGNSKVKEISLSEYSFSMDKGSEKTIRIYYSPSDATDMQYSASTDSGCVTVKCSGTDIRLYANYAGTCKITVKTVSGITTSCTVNVNDDSYVDENYDYPYQEYADEILRLVNEERTSRGLSEYKLRNDITKIANRRAEEISENYTHECPDGTYIWNVLVESGITGAASENIAFGQDSPEAVVNAWMNSAPHRESILSERYNKLGVGYYEKNGVNYWVQIFIK